VSCLYNGVECYNHKSIARDCYQFYLTETWKLKTFLKTDCTRVALTTNCWTSIQNLSYLVITAYFIGNDGNYQKRIISFILVPNHKEDTIERNVEEVLREWGIRNVSTVASESTLSTGAKS
jgi:hypothetical protein